MWNYFLLTLLGDNFFSISVILDFVSQKVSLSVMSLILILLKKFSFSLLIQLTKRLRCILYAFLSMSFFVFKKLLFGKLPLHDFLFIFLFMKGTWFGQTYRFSMGTCLWIAKSRAALKRSHIYASWEKCF